MLVKGSFLSRWVNRFWVKSAVVPQNPLTELTLDLSRPIIYVLDQNSASDLLVLQKACFESALPDPYQPITVYGVQLSSVIYLHDWYLFKKTPLKKDQATYITQYKTLLSLHQQYAELDIQLVPVSFFWGRAPGKSILNKPSIQASNVSCLQKAWSICTAGRDNLVRFNKPISVRSLVDKNQKTPSQAYKLARLTLHYFSRQHRSSRGPQIPERKQMIKTILATPLMQETIKQYSVEKSRSETSVSKECESYLQEISSHFSYRFLRFFRAVLSKVWNGIYQGIEVNYAQKVREATQSGAEIIYMPCHRSHMDYLLLSYLLYAEGMVPPHVAAGVNLNFFPAGSIFRRSGAFFLRRSFKDNPLYGKVFKAYFAMLFKKGYPIEFFTEGGRSRTGRLLPAKTGLLAMSLQTFLDQPERNVMIVPVYIGYDHIMEVSTYMKELSGQKKEKESLWQTLSIIKKLRNFGRAFVNFGEPINLKQYLDQQQPEWRDRTLSETEFSGQVNHLATNVMEGINNVTAVNALPLCAAILLASEHHQLGKQQMLELIALHQMLLKLTTATSLMTYPQESPESIYQQALSMNKFSEVSNLISSDQKQSAHLTYYRNTIVHVFALPSLVSFAILKFMKEPQKVEIAQLEQLVKSIYHYIETEYFLRASQQDLSAEIKTVLALFEQADLIRVDDDNIEVIDVSILGVISAHLDETRLRYQAVLTILINASEQSVKDVLSACKEELMNKSIEPFDEKVINVFIKALEKQTLKEPQKLKELLAYLSTQ